MIGLESLEIFPLISALHRGNVANNSRGQKNRADFARRRRNCAQKTIPANNRPTWLGLLKILSRRPSVGQHLDCICKMAARDQDTSRAKKTLYVTGFDPRRATKELLEELFMQGGPVTDVKLFDSHAYVQFQDPESVSYSLALFSEIELHGQKLRINAKQKSRESLSHLKYLQQVREILREQYKKIPPPKLPPKKMPPNTKQSPSGHKKRARDDRPGNRGNLDRSRTGSDSKSSHRRRARRQDNCDRSRSSAHSNSGRRRR